MDTRQIREVFNIADPSIKEIPTQEVPCLICGKRNMYPLNTFVLNNIRFHTVRCKEDGMMWLDPQPTEPFYDYIYNKRYHTGANNVLDEQATLDVLSNEEKQKTKAIDRLDTIEEFTKPPGLFLEVGFGGSYTLLEAKKRGWKTVGLELAKPVVIEAKAKGLEAYWGSFLEWNSDKLFDVIAMYDLIEHTHNPPAYLDKAYSLLKPDGTLVVRLPETQKEGPPASLIAHTYHFNEKTITEIMKRSKFQIIAKRQITVWKPIKYPGELKNVTLICKKLSY